MSLPINQLVYAGVWDVTRTYPQYYFVLSPIDNLCYVNIDIVPVTGGSDPSVQPSTIWLLFPNVTGDITGIIAGDGISGGGSTGSVTITNIGILDITASNGCASSGGQKPNITNTGVLEVTASDGCASSGGQNPNIINTGVLSLDGATGTLKTLAGQYYKTAPQTSSTLGPTTIPITWDASTSWTDTATLSLDVPTKTLFTVTQKGLYHLQVQLMFDNFATAKFKDDEHQLNINILRGPVANSPIRGTFYLTSSEDQPDVFVAGIYELQVGDIVSIEVVNDLQNDSFGILSQSGGANAYDYNTFFTWALIKPLP
jgi:hypothetical protein